MVRELATQSNTMTALSPFLSFLSVKFSNYCNAMHCRHQSIIILSTPHHGVTKMCAYMWEFRYTQAYLYAQQAVTTCGSGAARNGARMRKGRTNGEIMRKWIERGEKERKWRENLELEIELGNGERERKRREHKEMEREGVNGERMRNGDKMRKWRVTIN